MERRKGQRISFGLRVVLTQKGETFFTENISNDGCFLPADAPVKIGEKLDLAIDLPAFGYVSIKGEIRHIGDGGVGVTFVVFSDSAAKRALEEFLYVVSLCSQLNQDSPDSLQKED
ncbi:MAG: PilZ domain-containing protein [Pseudomonadota bacterium]